MGIDYYNILKLTPSATDDDIKKSYRKLAMKYHPDKQAKYDRSANEMFMMVAEAYTVLIDPRKRTVYDKFGQEGLKNGIPNTIDTGAWTQGYTFHGNAERVFREFFGGENPFKDFFVKAEDHLGNATGGMSELGKKRKDPPIEHDLNLTLEEVYHGCLKKMNILRRVMNEDGRTFSTGEKILSVIVKRGWKENTRITFPEEGDQGPNNIPADIVFILKDKEHPRFRREGINLVYTAKIHLGKALMGCRVDILTLDQRLLHIPINNIITPGYRKIVPNEGMPISSDLSKKGDLFIEFDVTYPKKLSQDDKDLIKQVFNK